MSGVSSASGRSVYPVAVSSSDVEDQALLARRFCGLFPSESRYRAVRAANSDLWLGHAGWLMRPGKYVGFDQELSWLPLRMRLAGTSLAARSGSDAQRDIAAAFSQLGRQGCSADMIRQTLLYAPDANAWHAIQTLVRYGLLDVRERTKLVLPAGAPTTSSEGQNFASHVHGMALLGLNSAPASGRDRNQAGARAAVSLRQRFEDLRDVGVNLNMRDALGRSPLHYAAINNNFQAVRALLRAGAKPEPRCNDDNTPLVSAIKFGSVDALAALLKGGADFNARCLGAIDKRVLKIYAHWVAHRPSEAEVAVEREKRVRKPGEWAPVHWAACLTAPSSVGALRLLLDSAERAGGSRARRRMANLPTAGSGQTPLQFAIRARDPQKVQCLLEAGADPNIESRDRKHPLQLVAAWGGGDLAEMLIAYGANVDRFEPPLEGYTRPWYPIDTAIRYRNEGCALAIARGAPHQVNLQRMRSAAMAGMVNLFDLMVGGDGPEGRRRAAQTREDGWGMLHSAALAERPEMVTALVKRYGLNPNATTHDGKVPGDLAEYPEVWRRLRELGGPLVGFKHDVSYGQ